MPERRRHPRKDVEDVLAEAEQADWRVIPTGAGHRWGVLRCPEATREGCQASIWSTPRNAGNHARQLRRVVHRCPHTDWSEGA